MLDMVDLAVMAARLQLVTGGRRVAGGDLLPRVNDQTVSPAMLKLSQSALEGGAGVHSRRPVGGHTHQRPAVRHLRQWRVHHAAGVGAWRERGPGDPLDPEGAYLAGDRNIP